MSAPNDREGPLPIFLFVLTAVTGVVDAVSFLALGNVFVANMTGNVVFLGFAAAGAPNLSIPASLTAIAAFMAGAFGGGFLGASASHRARMLAIALAVKVALVAIAMALAVDGPLDDTRRYGLIVLMSISMGLQNATARRLAIADLTTTVLTLTLTGLAADSRLVGGSSPRRLRRAFSALSMLAGAIAGAWLVLNVNVASALLLAFMLLAANAVGVWSKWSSTEPWTAPA